MTVLEQLQPYAQATVLEHRSSHGCRAQLTPLDIIAEWQPIYDAEPRLRGEFGWFRSLVAMLAWRLNGCDGDGVVRCDDGTDYDCPICGERYQ